MTSFYLHKGYSYVLNNPLRFTDPSGYMYDPAEHEPTGPLLIRGQEPRYQKSWQGQGGDPFAGVGFDYGNLASAYGLSMNYRPNEAGPTWADYANANPDYWSYNWETGQYENSATGTSMDTYSASRSLLPWYGNYYGAPKYGIFENAYYDNGEWVGNGTFGIYQIGFMKPTLGYPTFDSRISAENYLGLFEVSNSWALNMNGIINATLLMAGGVAEMAVGGAVEFFSVGTSSPLTVPMMIDGAGRTVANAQRLRMYLRGNHQLADAYPTSLGGAIGKIGDLINGTPMNQVGNGQAILGTVNDFTAFVATGGSGFALQEAVTNPSFGTSAYFMFTYFSYIYTMSDNIRNIDP